MEKTPYKSGPPKRKKLKKIPATQIITELPEIFLQFSKIFRKKGASLPPSFLHLLREGNYGLIIVRPTPSNLSLALAP